MVGSCRGWPHTRIPPTPTPFQGPSSPRASLCQEGAFLCWFPGTELTPGLRPRPTVPCSPPPSFLFPGSAGRWAMHAAPQRQGPNPIHRDSRRGGSTQGQLGTSGSPIWAQRGKVGVLGGPGLQHACLSCPFMGFGVALGCLCLFPFSLQGKPLPTLGFLGGRKGLGGGGWRAAGKPGPGALRMPHPDTLFWGPAWRGFWEAEPTPRVPTLPVGVLRS